MLTELSARNIKSSLLDGLEKGTGIQGLTTNLAQEALGIAADDFINPVTIYLNDMQTSSSLQIPVNPDQITLKWDRMTETMNILSLGDVEFTTGEKLQEISFSSFFPSEYVPSYCKYADIPNPLEAHQRICNWRSRINDAASSTAKEPIRLIITGTLDINMLVLITHYEATEKGGEPGDIYYNITCREWKEVVVRTEEEQRSKPKRPDLKPIPKTATLKMSKELNLNEELFKIAKRYYVAGENWKRIMNSNTAILKNDDSKAAIKLVL